MAASPTDLDATTGLPVGQQNLRQPTMIASVSQSLGRTDVSKETAVQTGQQAQTAFQDILSTTPEALAALHTLIGQLTSKPAISEEQLNAKAPKVVPQYTGTGWAYVDPLTGAYMTQTQANQTNAAREVQRQQMVAQAGMLPAGTPEQQKVTAERMTEIGRSRAQQEQYGKPAAMADAQALINKAIADGLRTAMPQIVAASEGAGTSKGTFRALATQEAATRAGIEGGALGANLSVQYGQIYNQLESVLELLTRQDPNGPSAQLLQALNIAKGIAQKGTTSTVTSSTQRTVGDKTTQVGPETKTGVEARDYDQTAIGGLGMLPVTGRPAAPAAPTNPYYIFAKGTDQPQGAQMQTGTQPLDAAVTSLGGNVALSPPTFPTYDTNANYAELTGYEIP